MADIRIKDLTTTASSTASDDFIAVDGTTNGTRKLSAFSPTFGGNATVTGTLTVNSTSPSVFAGRVRSNLSNTSLGDSQLHVQNAAASATNGALSQATFFVQPGYTTFVGTTGDGTTASYQGGVLGNAIRFNEGYVITDAANGLLLHGINGSIRLATGNPGSVKATFDSAGTLSLTATTASTTTSSGALVVGNGTSGGLGVGGNITLGGGVNIAGAASDPLPAGTSGIWTLSGSGLRINSAGVTFASLTGTTLGTATVTVNGTTTSSTTSSGALVVSGGVGVGGNINAGGYLRSINSSAANGSEFTALRADVGADGTLGAALVTIGVLPSATAASRYGFITCYDNGDWRTLYLGGSPGVAANGGQVRVPANISSTSTSSGALVVSGGVGVAGAIYAGGNIVNTTGTDFSSVATSLAAIHTVSSAPRLTLIRSSSSANNKLFDIINNADGQVTFRFVNDDFGGATSALQLTKTSATVVGSLQTGAPSGGTAAAWKLGTVATVSPTSPNRTIEVDIGGTIYYIHAKTTNN